MKTLSVISGLIFMIGFIPYVLSILGWRINLTGSTIWFGKAPATKPAKVSWIIWGTLDWISFAGMWASHTVNGQITGACIGVLIVIGFAWKYGEKGWSKLDQFSLAGAVLGVLLWWAFDNPVMGIVTSCIVASIGSIPTFVSAWKDPSREDKLAWTIFTISCVLALIAIPQWTLADAAQPMTFAVIEFTMMYILYVRPRFR